MEDARMLVLRVLHKTVMRDQSVHISTPETSKNRVFESELNGGARAKRFARAKDSSCPRRSPRRLACGERASSSASHETAVYWIPTCAGMTDGRFSAPRAGMTDWGYPRRRP